MRRTRWSRTGGPANRPSPWVLLALETLEERDVPAEGLFLVNLPGDPGTGPAGSGDFRYCLQQSNQYEGQATIRFDIDEVLSLNLALPSISHDVIVQGRGAANTVIARPGSVANFPIF